MTYSTPKNLQEDKDENNLYKTLLIDNMAQNGVLRDSKVS